MIVVKTKYKQIISRNTTSKLSITMLLSENQNRDKVVSKNRQKLNKADTSSSQNNIIISQKQTKIDKFIHKLHSLHSFI